jgi:dipicolinate synthase subunit A
MKTKPEILMINGDERQKYMYEYLLKENFNVILKNNYDNKKYESIILPINYENIDEIISIANKTPIFAGRIPAKSYELAKNLNVELYDYFENEEVKYKNAILTAEAAIAIAINDYKKSLRDSNCLIIGFGRIGKILLRYLENFTHSICISARKEKDFSYIKALGFDFCHTEIIKNAFKYNIIFNTVPHLVINENVLKNLNKETYIIDLASAPGGTDFMKATELGIKFNHALALPGKYSPVSAGEILGASVSRIIKERS